jgi:hypothetical protein
MDCVTWAGFHVDLIGSWLRMTGQPEHVPPLAENAIPEVDQHGYQAYPRAKLGPGSRQWLRA